MESFKADIRDRIVESGWRIVEVHSDEWWVREMWRLESDAATAFVTFLVDPADMEKVWAVLATKTKPIDYAGEPPRYVLPFERLESDLGEFIDFLHKQH